MCIYYDSPNIQRRTDIHCPTEQSCSFEISSFSTNVHILCYTQSLIALFMCICESIERIASKRTFAGGIKAFIAAALGLHFLSHERMYFVDIT